MQRILNYYPNYPTHGLYFGEVETFIEWWNTIGKMYSKPFRPICLSRAWNGHRFVNKVKCQVTLISTFRVSRVLGTDKRPHLTNPPKSYTFVFPLCIDMKLFSVIYCLNKLYHHRAFRLGNSTCSKQTLILAKINHVMYFSQ